MERKKNQTKKKISSTFVFDFLPGKNQKGQSVTCTRSSPKCDWCACTEELDAQADRDRDALKKTVQLQ